MYVCVCVCVFMHMHLCPGLAKWLPWGWGQGSAVEGPPGNVQSPTKGREAGPLPPTTAHQAQAAPKPLPGLSSAELASGAPGRASGGPAPLLATPARGPPLAAQSTWCRHCRQALPTLVGAPGRWPSPAEARRGPAAQAP